MTNSIGTTPPPLAYAQYFFNTQQGGGGVMEPISPKKTSPETGNKLQKGYKRVL